MNKLLKTGLPVLLVLASACRPQPPPTDEPPQPQAANAGNTQMRDAIQAPLEKARAVEDVLQQSAHAQRAALDAQEDAAAADIEQGRAELTPSVN